MRSSRSLRLAPLALAAVLLVAACGESLDGSDAADGATTETTAADGATATTAPGEESDGSDGTGDTAAGDADTSNGKPEVQIPDTLPTELVITDLVEGTGDAAVVGDTVVVNYVGVRSEDGTEFDNSYDTGAPFSVPLGGGRVIAGWDQGLVGVKVGGQRQLDIPADLAYGDSPQGDVIQPGDALTFVVDVIAVLAKSDPADAPTISVEPGTTADSLQIEDLTTGAGDEIQPGQSIAFDYIFIRADTGEQLESSWESGSPQTFPYDEVQLPPVLFEALAGLQVGTLRQVTIPFADASDIFQLPGDTDVVLVMQVNAIY